MCPKKLDHHTGTGTTATTTTTTKLTTTPITWAASYDNRNRLTSFGRTGTSTSYTYDANSNRLSSIDTRTRDTDLSGSFDQAATSTTSQATAQTTNQALSIASDSNRLLGFSQTLSTTTADTSGATSTNSATTQVGYTLDANGNLTSDAQHHFVYDAANRLSQVDIIQGEQASNVTYLHNALGQRVFKSELQEAQLVSNKPQTGINLIDLFIKFFYWLFNQAPADPILGQSYLFDDATLGDTPSLLGEYGNGGNLSQGNTEYIWLPTEGGQAQLIGLYKDQHFYAIHTDHLGTPRLITDDTNQVVWQWAYSAFGDNQPTGILSATPNPNTSATPAVLLKATAPQLTMNLRMAGQYFDEESGLFENGFRSYRPGMGAYTQPDLIGLAGGTSRFGYVGGDPLSFVDPEGLKKIILLPPTDPNYPAAVNSPDDPNVCLVISHGSPQSVNHMNAKQLNKLLSKQCQPKQPVKLDACRTGQGENSIAEQLAKLRKTPVVAPDERTWTTPWGTNFDNPYSPMSLDPTSQWNTIPDLRKPGIWRTF